MPSNYSLNTPFRISGFTFSLGGGTGVLVRLGPPSPFNPAPDQTKIRIDHNRFTNGAAGNTSAHALWVYGAMYGVADNNIFDSIFYPMKHDPQLSGTNYGGQWSWNNWTLTFGSPNNNFYVEDNIITLPADSYGDSTVTDCQYSGRYAYRYNTITQMGKGNSMFDMHGNQGGGVSDQNAMWSCFGGELYGNQINTNGQGGRFLNQRGGKTLAFFNNFNGGSMGFDITEEHADSEEPTTNPEPQHVHDSYYWNNRINQTGTLINLSLTTQINGVPQQNKDFWTDITDIGSSGAFCGPLENRPSNCATGQSYWATNQNCSNLSGLVGDRSTFPSRAVIAGTLYRCTSTNTWTSYYQPYTYPHPLRNETPSLALLPPANLRLALQ